MASKSDEIWATGRRKAATARVRLFPGTGKIKVNGKMEILNLEFSPEVLKPEKKEYLERLFIKTWANAQKEVEKLIRKEIKMQLPNIPF